MTHRKEHNTTSSREVVFNSAISSNTTTIGAILDLQSIYKTAFYGIHNNTTANSTSQKTTTVQSVDFDIYVLSYTDGVYTPIVEGLGVQDVPVNFPDQYNVTMTSTQAENAFALVTNPAVNTIYNVPNSKIVSYNYPTVLPASGSFVDLNREGNPQLPIIANAISRADASISTNNKLNFRFAVIPGFGPSGSNYNYLRFSIKSESVTTGATIFVVANKVYEAMY